LVMMPSSRSVLSLRSSSYLSPLLPELSTCTSVVDSSKQVKTISILWKFPAMCAPTDLVSRTGSYMKHCGESCGSFFCIWQPQYRTLSFCNLGTSLSKGSGHIACGLYHLHVSLLFPDVSTLEKLYRFGLVSCAHTLWT
jgi:hypothetical protein